MPKSNKTSATDTQLAVIIHELGLAFSRLFNRNVKHLGLTRAQWQVLRALYSAEGRTQTELADELSIATPPMGKILDKLEASGWITRKADLRDRRVNRIYLTDKVNPHIEPLSKHVEQLRKIATQGLTKTEQKLLVSLLLRMQKNLDEELKR